MKRVFVLLFAVVMAVGANAQKANGPVIFEINGKKIYKSEFMREFLRSIGKDPAAAPTACTYEKRQALEEYVDLFVNYRAKLEDAFAQGFDTMPDMVKELKGYRNELAAPYLIDSATLESILHEAYERNHYTLHGAHIFVKLGKQPTPADTLKAYNRAMAYYNRVKNGEDFFTVAAEAAELRFKEERIPEGDPRRKDNGELGNFSVFDMVYPFESAAYSLEPGEVSLPVRTNYGYHIIKLLDKSLWYGKGTFQHIWVSTESNPATAETRIRQAYEQLVAGEDFASVCKSYSDDKSSAENGGQLSGLMAREIPPEYVSHLSRMQPGEITEPFPTKFGWHILLLNSRDSLPAYEDMVPYYKQRLTRDSRSRKPRETFIEQCKKHYNFNDYTKAYMKPVKAKGKKANNKKIPLASLDECKAAMTDSVFSKQWHYSDTMVTDMRPLFSIEDSEYTAKDLLKFVESKQKAEMPCDLGMYLEDRYNNFINDKVFEYANDHLEEEHNEFAMLMDEYRNGLMIFAYNDKMIWSKAIKDTVGIAEFYKTASKQHNIDNENDAPYFWNERAKLTVVSIPDSASIAPEKVVKVMEKATKKGWTVSEISGKVNSMAKGDANFKVEKEKVVEKEHQNILQSNQWRKGIYVRPSKGGYDVVRVDSILDPCLKSFSEARGYYINDYQNYLEQQLIERLRKQYNVIIHQDVVDEITY